MSAGTKFKKGDKVMLSPTFYRDIIGGSADDGSWGCVSLRKMATAGGVATVTHTDTAGYEIFLDVVEYVWHHTWLMHVPSEDTPVLENNPFEFSYGDRITDGAGNEGAIIAMGVYSDGVPVYVLANEHWAPNDGPHYHSGRLGLLVATAKGIRRVDEEPV